MSMTTQGKNLVRRWFVEGMNVGDARRARDISDQIFAVDFIPIQTLLFRNLPDTASPPEWEESLKRVLALDWERMIPGHPYAGGRLGTKQDVQDLIGYMQDLAAEVKKAAAEGKCTDTAMKDVKLPKYEKWGNYAAFLPMNVERYCYLNNGN